MFLRSGSQLHLIEKSQDISAHLFKTTTIPSIKIYLNHEQLDNKLKSCTSHGLLSQELDILNRVQTKRHRKYKCLVK